jgi:hypothetical protein
MQNITLAFVLDRIVQIYGRTTPDIEARLTADLNMWMSQACRRWNFWFLDVNPGLYLPTLFPIDPTTLSSTATDPLTNTWVDRGWLLTQANQFVYEFVTPRVVNLNTIPSDDSWEYTELGRLFSVKLFNPSGTQKREITVMNNCDIVSNMRYDSVGEPYRCSWETDNGISRLFFTPNPDQSYLVQIYYRLAEVPPLTDQNSTNAFLQNYPQAVITAGLIIASRYFGETKELSTYQMELFGADYAQKRGSDATPGGLVGEIISDTRKRMQPRNKTLGVYTSAKQALSKRRYNWYDYTILWRGWI